MRLHTRGEKKTKLLQPGQQHEKYTRSRRDTLTHEQTPGCGGSRYFTGLGLDATQLECIRPFREASSFILPAWLRELANDMTEERHANSQHLSQRSLQSIYLFADPT